MEGESNLMTNLITIEQYELVVGFTPDFIKSEVKISVQKPLEKVELLLDSNNSIDSIFSPEAPGSFSRESGNKLSVVFNNPVQEFCIRYEIPHIDNRYILPGTYHFPVFSNSCFYPEIKLRILHDPSLRWITNSVHLQDEFYTVDSLKHLVIAWEPHNQAQHIWLKVKGEQVWADEATIDLFQELDIVKEIRRFLSFYYTLFDRSLELTIVSLDQLPARALSYKSIALIDTGLCKRPSLLLYQYLFHEVIHQEIGVHTTITGLGKLWLLESFTEFLQLLYLQERFGSTFIQAQLEYYYRLYRENQGSAPAPSISDFDDSDAENIQAFLSVICGKGTLVFYALYQKFIRDKSLLRKMIKEFAGYGHCISLSDFKMILTQNLPGEIDKFFSEYIESNDVDMQEIRKLMRG